MSGVLQEGIAWDKGARPRRFLKLLVLRASSDLHTSEFYIHVQRLWAIWQSLKQGIVPSLGPNYPVNPAGLQVLIGYGHRFFERTDLARQAPEGMNSRFRFPQPVPAQRTPVLPGSGIRYDTDVESNAADADIVVQLTADTALAVHRAQVETWKYLINSTTSGGAPLPLFLSAFYDGFGRDDRRSWIDFHDGISNLRKGEERRQVIAIKPDNAGGQDWTLNGTYLVFMRLPVHLQVWESCPQSQQEILVGRTKQSGCPLVNVDQGLPVEDSRCPVEGTREVIEPGNEAFREPTSVVSDQIKMSHVQRSNHHRRPHFRPDSRRIYRQGFEFLEPSGSEGGFRVGLNFVSFQDDPHRTFFILTQLDWLGGLAFGGDSNAQHQSVDRLLSVRAAGTYFVPPVHATAPFPGSDMFAGAVT